MLLAFEVGNTNIDVGVFSGETLRANWRMGSGQLRTGDEYAVMLESLFQFAHMRLDGVRHAIISCVMPPVLGPLSDFCRRYLHIEPLVVGPGVKTGMPILYDNPREVGADRIVTAVAAYEEFRRSVIVVDFGTATTFDFISSRGEYMGGAIATGLSIAAEALFSKTSKLPRVEMVRPPKIIATNTVNSIQAGLFFGYTAMVDGLVAQMKAEAGEDPPVIATGGLSAVIASGSSAIDRVDPLLAMKGLRILYERNR